MPDNKQCSQVVLYNSSVMHHSRFWLSNANNFFSILAGFGDLLNQQNLPDIGHSMENSIESIEP